MRRLGRTGKPDANHAQIVQALRSCGWLVISTSGMGYGCPDAFVAKGGRLVPIEIKDGSKVPSARKLTPAEVAMHAKFSAAGCPVVLMTSVADAVRLA